MEGGGQFSSFITLMESCTEMNRDIRGIILIMFYFVVRGFKNMVDNYNKMNVIILNFIS